MMPLPKPSISILTKLAVDGKFQVQGYTKVMRVKKKKMATSHLSLCAVSGKNICHKYCATQINNFEAKLLIGNLASIYWHLRCFTYTKLSCLCKAIHIKRYAAYVV